MNSGNIHDDGCAIYIWIFILAIYSFGNTYKTYMVYNFGEYCKSTVVGKKSIHHPGFRGPGITDYYVHLDVLGEMKECSETLYDKLEENTTIKFFIYNDDPYYLILSEKNERDWATFLKKGLQWYHKLFLIVFIAVTSFYLIWSYYRVLARIFKGELKEKEIFNRWDAILTTIIHSIIFVFGIGCSYYIGWLIFNNISNNENLSITLVGFYTMLMLAIVIGTPFLLQQVYEAYQKNNSGLVKRAKKIAIIFTLLNVLFGFFGTLMNENPNDFTIKGMFKLILRYWDVILGG